MCVSCALGNEVCDARNATTEKEPEGPRSVARAGYPRFSRGTFRACVASSVRVSTETGRAGYQLLEKRENNTLSRKT